MPPQAPDLKVTAFLPNELVAIAARTHPLAARRQPISLKELCGYPFLQREVGSGTRMTIENHLQKYGLRVQQRMEPGSNFVIEQAVATGLGVSIVSLTMCKACISATRFAF